MAKRLLILLALVIATLTAAGAAQAASARSCGDEIDTFIRSLRQLDSRLDVGLNYTQYNERLGDISVAYDDAVDALDPSDGRCLYVAIRGEKAFNLYLKAGRVWDRCFDDLNCSNADIEPQLQKIWAKAHKRVRQAWNNIR